MAASAGLLETCVDEVILVPVPIATAGLEEELCPGAAHPSRSAAAEENLTLTEAAARLKQLELESAPVSASRSNINLNMNNQEDVLKLTDKCLSSVGSSPALSQLTAPDELKSNILKAQAEAVLRGVKEEAGATGEKNCNLQEAAARLKGRGGRMGSTSSLTVSGFAERQEPREALKQPVLQPSSSLEVKGDEFASSVASLPAEPVNEAHPAKGKAEEQEAHAPPQSENLIDFTDPTPVLPQVQPPKPIITPRWIIPAATQTGTFTNGLLEHDSAAKMTPHHPEGGALASLPHLSHTHNVIATSIVAHPPKEDNNKPKGLLTTEL